MSTNDDDKRDDGAKNLDAAISGSGMTREQIEAMGGEIDEIDEFQPTPEDRGDVIPNDDEPDDSKRKPEDEEEEEDDDDSKSEEEEEDDDDSKSEEEEEDDDDDSKSEEEEEDDDDSDDKKGKKKEGDDDEQRIPKRRFDEVNARRKAAEKELAALKAQQKAADDGEKDEFDFDAAQEEYQELLLSGKTKEAAAKFKEIRAAERAQWEAEISTKATTTVEATRVQEELDTLVDRYEKEFDEFNPESDNYSEDLVDEVQTFFIGYSQRQDLTPKQAFELAVNTTAKLYGLSKKGEGAATDADDKGKKGEGDDKKNTRRKAKKDTKKKVDMAKRAPKDTSKTGEAGDSAGESALPDISQMTDEEYDALPESTKKRLRGDAL